MGVVLCTGVGFLFPKGSMVCPCRREWYGKVVFHLELFTALYIIISLFFFFFYFYLPSEGGIQDTETTIGMIWSCFLHPLRIRVITVGASHLSFRPLGRVLLLYRVHFSV